MITGVLREIIGIGDNAHGRGGRARRGAVGEGGGGRWKDGSCAGVGHEQKGLWRR